ncbi:MAG: fibronectin type III domain-containing protein [Bacteroidota bacterium]
MKQFITNWSRGSGGTEPPLKWLRSLALTALFMLGLGSAFAQTDRIPINDGNFSNGSTFTANGWSVSNGGTPNHQWIVSSGHALAAPFAGNAAFVSNDGTAYAYTPANNSNVFFWRDVTVPAGETSISLSFNWNQQGESTWDIWQVFVAPTTVNPVGNNTHPGSGATNVPSPITGATYVGNGALATGIQSFSGVIPPSFAGSTFRLIFSWKNETGGTQPPAAIDNIRLISSPPATYTATAQGGLWSSPGTWVGGFVPPSGAGNSIVIPSGSVVTVDQVINYQDYTINGGMQWNATSTNTMTATGNVTIGGGSFYPFTTGLSGVQINLLGNFTNNSYANLALSTLVFGGTGTQTLGGTGTYEGMAGTGAVGTLVMQGSGTLNVAVPISVRTLSSLAGTITGGSNINVNNRNTNVFGARKNQVQNVVVTNMGSGYTTAPFVGGASAALWTSAAVSAGNLRINPANGHQYVALNAASSITAPTHTDNSVAVVDGISWLHVGPAGNIGTAFAQGSLTPSAGTQYFCNGKIYTCISGAAMTPAQITAAAPFTTTDGALLTIGTATFRVAGNAASVTVNHDATNGVVRSLSVSTVGTGYTNANPTIAFVPNTTGTGATATAFRIAGFTAGTASLIQKQAGGNIGSPVISSTQGIGGVTTGTDLGFYLTAPTVGVGGPTGINFVTAQGSGYTSAPTVAFTGGTIVSGTNTFATVVAAGRVLSITLTTSALYSVPPTGITITGGGGSGATAALPANCWAQITASLAGNGQINSYTVTQPGFGYLAAPTLALSTAGAGERTATAPTCVANLFNLQCGNFTPVTINGVAPTLLNATHDESGNLAGCIPTNRRINILTSGAGGQGITFTGNITIYAATGGLVLTSGNINLGGNTLTFETPTFLGQSAGTASGVINGSIQLNGISTTTLTRTFPFATSPGSTGAVQLNIGSGSLATGSNITRITVTQSGAPSGTAGTANMTGARSFTVDINAGTTFGTNPTMLLGFGALDILTSDNPTLRLCQSNTGLSSGWTIRSVSSGTGALSANGTRTTATVGPEGPIVFASTMYFGWASTFTPPPALNYTVTRTTGDVYNSIAPIAAGGDGTGTLSTAFGDEGTQQININSLGFTYQGSPVTSATIHANGYIALNNGLYSYTGASSWDNTLSADNGGSGTIDANKRNVLAPFYDDLNKASPVIYYKTVGTQFIAEWFNTTFYGLAGPQLYYQVVLDAADQSITFKYGDMQLYNGTQNVRWSYTCGISGSFIQTPVQPGQIMQQQFENSTFFTHENNARANWGANGLAISPEPHSSIKFTPGSYVPVAAPSATPPPNDNPAGAITLPALTQFPSNIAWDYINNRSNLYTTRYATNDPSIASCAGPANPADVWFKFVANNPDMTVRIYGSGGFIPRVEVRDEFNNPLAPAQCNVGVQGITVDATLNGLAVGDIYFVRVSHDLTGTTASALASVSGGIASISGFTSGTNYTVPIAAFSYVPNNQGPIVRVSGGGGGGFAMALTNPFSTAISQVVSTLTQSNFTTVGGLGYTSAPSITIDSPNWGITGEFGIIVYAAAANDNYATATRIIPTNTTTCVTPLTGLAGTTTNGTSTLTMTSTSALGAVGDQWVLSGSNLPSNVIGTVASATTVTLSSNATGTGSITFAANRNQYTNVFTGAATQSPQTVCAGTPDDDVWFVFQSAASYAKADVTGNTNFDPQVEVFEATTLGGPITSINCQAAPGAGGTNSVFFATTSGNYYYLRIYHAGAGATTSSFSVCVNDFVPPPGFFCAAPKVIASIPYTDSDNSANFGNQYGSQSCSVNYGDGNDVTYLMDWSAESASTFPRVVNISLNNTDNTGWIGFFVKGPALADCENTTGCLDFAVSGGSSSVSKQVTITDPGKYYIIIDYFPAPSSSNYTLSLNYVCPQIVGLSTSAITTTAATLNWTASAPSVNGYTVEMRQLPSGTFSSTAFGLGVQNPLTGNVANVSGLTAATQYEYRVTASCYGSPTPTLATVSATEAFTTDCPASTAPLTWNFDGVTPPALPICFNKVVAGGCAVETATAGGPVSTPNQVRFTNTAAANPAGQAILVLPKLSDIDGINLRRIKFNGKSNVAGYTLEVGTMSDPFNPATFVSLNTFAMTTGNVVYTYQFDQVTTTDEFVAFRMTQANLGGSRIIYVDNIIWEEIPPCADPIGLATSAITTSSATVSWTAVVGASGYNLEYREVGDPFFSPFSGNPVSGTSASLTGLSDATTHEWRVQANCTNPPQSAFTQGPSFTTLCGAANVPYNEDFEGITANDQLPNCMAVANATMGAGIRSYATAPTGTNYNRIPRSGTKFISYYYTPNGVDKWIFTKGIQLTAGFTYAFKAFYITDGFSGWNTLEAAYGSTQNAAGMTNTIVTVSSPTNTTYQAITGNIIPATSGVYYFGIKCNHSGVPWYLTIDDISVAIPSACPTPGDPNYSAITTNSATLNWAAGGSETAWDIEGGPAPYAFSGVPTISNVSNNSAYVISGLNSSTTYEYKVRARCSGVLQSDWSSSTSFSTLCSPASLPYTENFEGILANNTLPSCMAVGGTTLGNGVLTYIASPTGTLYNRIARSGTKFASFNWTPTGTNKWLFTRGVNLTAGQTYIFTAHYITDGFSGWNTVQASYGTSQSPAGMTNNVITLSGPTNTSYQEMTGLVTPSSSGEHFFGIMVNNNGTPWYLSVDDISVIEAPACPTPNTATDAPVSLTSIQLNWTVLYGTPSSYEIEYRTNQSFTGTPNLTGIAGNNTTITGLSAQTTYFYRVRSRCSPTSVGAWSSIFTFTTPPANDACADAIVVTPNTTVVCNNTVSGTTRGATGSVAGCAPFGATADDDVWYKFTAANTSHIVTVSPAFGFDPAFEVWENGCAGIPLTGGCVNAGANGVAESVSLTGLTVGSEYLVRIYMRDVRTATENFFTGDPIEYGFSLCISSPVPAAGVDCDNPVIVSTFPYTSNYTTNFMGNDLGAQTSTCASGYGNGNDVVYRIDITPATAGRKNIRLQNLNATKYMGWFLKDATNCLTTSSSLACATMGNIDICQGAYTFTPGTYYLVVDHNATLGTAAASYLLQIENVPGNDDPSIATAPLLTSGPTCSPTAGTVLNAGASGQAVGTCGGTPDEDVWYRFTATTPSQIIIVSTNDTWVNRVEVWDNALASNLGCASGITANGVTTTRLSIAGLTGGQNYYIRVYGANTGVGSFSSNDWADFSICLQDPPANDNICGAVTLPVNNIAAYTAGDNTLATGSVTSVSSWGTNSNFNDLWYKVTVPAGGVVVLNALAGTYNDLDMQVYTSANNTCTGALTSVSTDLGSGFGNMPYLYVSGLTSGNTLFVQVRSNLATGFGTFQIAATDAVNWTGASNSIWETGANWFNESAPAANQNIAIPATVNRPVINSSPTVTNLTIYSNASSGTAMQTLTFGASSVLTVRGNLTTNNTVSLNGPSGTLRFTGTSAQTLTGNFIGNSRLEVNKTGGSFTLANTPGTSLVMNNVLTPTAGTITTNNKLTIASAGMVAPGGGTISGTATVQRRVFVGNYHYMTSPVNNTPVSTVESNFGDDTNIWGDVGYAYTTDPSVPQPSVFPTAWWYNEANADSNAAFGWTSATGAVEMNPGRGIAVKVYQNTGTTFDVNGNLNTGNISRAITYTNSGKPNSDGFNLLGNPYPSSLAWNNFYTTNSASIENALYLWDPVTNNYAAFNGTVWQNNAGAGSNDKIAHSQGFFVKAKSTITNPTNVNFTDAMRSTTYANNFFSNPVSTLRLKIENGGLSDETVIYLDENASSNYDVNIDASKLIPTFVSSPSLYTISDDNHNMAINVMKNFSLNTIIPLGVIAGETGRVTISAADLSALDLFTEIYLEDALTGKIINLKDQSSYAVDLSKGNAGSRFFLRFSKENTAAPSLSASQTGGFNIYSADNRVFVNIPAEIKGDVRIEVMNVLGQEMAFMNASNASGLKEISVPNAVAGNYLVKVVNDGKVYTQKLYLGNK